MRNYQVPVVSIAKRQWSTAFIFLLLLTRTGFWIKKIKIPVTQKCFIGSFKWISDGVWLTLNNDCLLWVRGFVYNFQAWHSHKWNLQVNHLISDHKTVIHGKAYITLVYSYVLSLWFKHTNMIKTNHSFCPFHQVWCILILAFKLVSLPSQRSSNLECFSMSQSHDVVVWCDVFMPYLYPHHMV